MWIYYMDRNMWEYKLNEYIESIKWINQLLYFDKLLNYRMDYIPNKKTNA